MTTTDDLDDSPLPGLELYRPVPPMPGTEILRGVEQALETQASARPDAGALWRCTPFTVAAASLLLLAGGSWA